MRLCGIMEIGVVDDMENGIDRQARTNVCSHHEQIYLSGMICFSFTRSCYDKLIPQLR